jgi:hypothetical protein
MTTVPAIANALTVIPAGSLGYVAQHLGSGVYHDARTTYENIAAFVHNQDADKGVLTASSPYTFKQTWDNVAQDVVFKAAVVQVQDTTSSVDSGAAESSYFAVERSDGVDTYTRLDVRKGDVRIAGFLDIYDDFGLEFGSRTVRIDGTNGTFSLGDPTAESFLAFYGNQGPTCDYSAVPGDPPDDSASYTATGITRNAASADFVLPISETALASWANVPTNTDIADGYSQCGIDTNTGDIYLAANVGGTIFKVQLS